MLSAHTPPGPVRRRAERSGQRLTPRQIRNYQTWLRRRRFSDYLRLLWLWCDMIKIKHTVFALPFAFSAAFITARGWPGFGKLLLLAFVLFCIRSFAMTVNRIADLPHDRKNPRTQNRPLVTGEIKVKHAWCFATFIGTVFVLSCAGLNMTCMLLSPLAILLALFYSYTKYLTSLCHFVLGAVLALAPLAGWLAVTPEFSFPPFILAAAVLFWVAGFDIIYACQDVEFDKQEGLHSFPAKYGVGGALRAARYCHVAAVVLLVLAGVAWKLSFGWYFALIFVVALFFWQHYTVKADKPESFHFAFFLNGPVSLILLWGALMGIYL